MKLLQTLQQRLGWKLFLSYLVIILVGVVVMAGTAEFHAPAVLDRHVARMRPFWATILPWWPTWTKASTPRSTKS